MSRTMARRNRWLAMAALVAAKFPADGALSLEYEETPENPLAAIRECVAAARAGMRSVTAG